MKPELIKTLLKSSLKRIELEWLPRQLLSQQRTYPSAFNQYRRQSSSSNLSMDLCQC